MFKSEVQAEKEMGSLSISIIAIYVFCGFFFYLRQCLMYLRLAAPSSPHIFISMCSLSFCNRGKPGCPPRSHTPARGSVVARNYHARTWEVEIEGLQQVQG